MMCVRVLRGHTGKETRGASLTVACMVIHVGVFLSIVPNAFLPARPLCFFSGHWVFLPSSSQNGARTGLLLYVVRTSSGQCRGRPFGAGHLSEEMISKVAFSYGEIWMEDDTHTNDVYTHIRHKSGEKTFYGHQHRHGIACMGIGYIHGCCFCYWTVDTVTCVRIFVTPLIDMSV